MKQVQMVSINRLKRRRQVRMNARDPSIQGLIESIKSVGLQQALLCQLLGDDLFILDGERRYWALKLLGWTEIPVCIEERQLNSSQVTIQQLVANCQRKGLTPLEIATGLNELMRETGITAADAAAACGFSEAWVSKVLTVLEASDPVRAKVASGELPLSTAYEIAKNCDAARQIELAEAAIAEKLTRREVQRRVKGKGRKQGRKAAKRPSPPVAVADLGAGRSITARGPDLTCIATLIAWLTEAVESLKTAMADGCELSSLREYFKERKRIRPA